MGLTVEHECLQCGGSIELDETDHLLRCPFCGVKNYLFTPNYFHFVLPHKVHDQEILYAPYLRFKGNVYFCRNLFIEDRFVDITHIGLECKGLPLSLGLRPQAMKLKFVTSKTRGSFLKSSLKAQDIVDKAAKLTSKASSGKILHRAYIGETLSLIYLPLFVQSNQIIDGILNLPIADVQKDADMISSKPTHNPEWTVTLMPTLCPKCGWDMEGAKDCAVLICSNCDTAWEPVDGKFKEIHYFSIPGQDKETVYLPFWRMIATSTGVEINTFADFIRVTNQPVMIVGTWETREMCFWSPAFKIRPKNFLQLSKQLTVSQIHLELEEKMPKKGLYPVTLPRNEAEQTMHLTLADTAINKENVFPYLPRIHFNIKDSRLVYLPFSDTGHEMVLEHMHIAINKQALEFGRKL